MIARPDAVSYTLPLQYFLDHVYSLRAASYNDLWDSCGARPRLRSEVRNIIEKDKGGTWRNSSEFVETNAHQYEHGWQAAVVWCVQSLFEDLMGLPCEVEEKLGKGRNNFRFSVNFKGGFVAFGGNNRVLDEAGFWVERPERMQLYLSGEYCQTLSDGQWKRLYAWSLGVDDLKITRLDLCVDDLQGRFPVSYALDQYRAGAFASGKGRPPKAKYMQDISESLDGETLYVGSRQSGKLGRIYDKGKQLGDSGSQWVRWEGELLAKDRQIPLDAIIRCDEYFAGIYPAFAVVLKALSHDQVEPAAIATGKEKAKILLGHLRNHCRRSYGPLIAFMTDKMEMSAESVIAALRGDRGSRPARLSVTALDAFCTSLVDRETGELKIPV